MNQEMGRAQAAQAHAFSLVEKGCKRTFFTRHAARGRGATPPRISFGSFSLCRAKKMNEHQRYTCKKINNSPGTCGLGAFPFPYPCFINKLMIRKSRYECFYDLRGGFTLKSGLTVPSISPYSCSCLRMLSRIKTRIWLFIDRPSYSATKLNLFSISSSMRMDTLFTAIKSPQNKFMMTLFYANVMI